VNDYLARFYAGYIVNKTRSSLEANTVNACVIRRHLSEKTLVLCTVFKLNFRSNIAFL